MRAQCDDGWRSAIPMHDMIPHYWISLADLLLVSLPPSKRFFNSLKPNSLYYRRMLTRHLKTQRCGAPLSNTVPVSTANSICMSAAQSPRPRASRNKPQLFLLSSSNIGTAPQHTARTQNQMPGSLKRSVGPINAARRLRRGPFRCRRTSPEPCNWDERTGSA